MSKKEEFIKLFSGIDSCPRDFLIEMLDICLTEERVRSKDFNQRMYDLTNRWIERIEDE